MYYVVTDEDGNHLSEMLPEYPSHDEQWRIWDTTLPLPRGHYPRVKRI